MSQSPKTFELFIEDPKTDLEKGINGKVIISSIGPKKNSIGELSGFPDGKTIKVGPTGETLTSELNILVNEVILILIDQVISEYNVDLTGRLKSIGPVLEEVEITPTTNQNVGTTGSTASQIDSEKVKDPKTINTKVTLIIKQGPPNAEIINGGERESNNGVIDFTGVQLTEPGDYVIEAIPDSPDLSSTTFNIKVDPEPEVIEQESEGVEEEEVQGDRPIITQILQPTIKLPPMKFDATESSEDNKEIGFGLGFTPFFWYNGVSISERDIKSLIIYYDDFLPKAQVILKDTTGLLENDETKPTNDTKFEIFINSGSDVLKSIHMRFKLEIDKKNPNGSHTLVGTLDIPEFYRIGYNSYKGTTFNVLKNICQETGLGYNSNIKDTEDSMSWKRNGVLLSEFIRGLIKRSYISDDSFMMGYIDYYYCFNYVDIEKEWNRDISNDVGISSQGVSQLDKASTEDDKIVQLALTNDSSANSSSFYFEDYKVKNNSTYQSTKRGMATISKVYDRVKKQFLVFKIDAKNEGDDKLILKGAKMDEEEQAANFRNNYSGKLDTSNMHPNYHYALDQNKRNLQNLVNMEVDMTLPQPNFNIYKFQKVQLNFVNPKPTTTDSNLTYDRLSGGWIVIDIKYVWLIGKLKQKLTLARKDMGKTKEEIENEVTAVDESENREINENEESNPVPNSRFIEGEVYLMEDESGRRFEVTIVTVLSNGEDFITTITTDIDLDSTEQTINTQEQVNENTNEVENLETPPVESPKWNSGELLLSGSFVDIEGNNIIVNWEVRNDNSIGFFTTFVYINGVLDEFSDTTYNNIKDAELGAKEYALDTFSDLGGVI
jgi:hypothetical protein